MTTEDSDLIQIHRRILQGDPTASLALFEAVHQRIVRFLQQPFGRQLTPDQLCDLATDAIMEYLKKPDRYDPGRSQLHSYLTLIARHDGLNLLRSLRSEQRGLRQFFEQVVEPGEVAGNMEEEVESARDASTLLERYGDEIADNEEDRAVLRLMLLGERETAAYASSLGIAHLPDEEKKALVKQRRDRIEKRLERLKGKL